MSVFSLSRSAAQDLDDIWWHIAQDNPEAADRVLDEIGRVCGLLLTQPMMGRARPELAPGLRSFPVARAYLLYYLPVADGLQAVRVLHGAQDAVALADRGGFDA